MLSRKVSRFVAVLVCLAALLSMSATAFATCNVYPQPVYYYTPTYYGETLYATTTLSVYAGPGTNYPIIGYVNAGYSVKRIGTVGSFSQIEALDLPGYTAYVQTAYLSSYYYNPNYYNNYYPWYNSCYNPCYYDYDCYCR